MLLTMLRRAVPADAAVRAVPPVPSITGNKFSVVRQGAMQGQPPSTCHRTSLLEAGAVTSIDQEEQEAATATIAG